MEQKPEILEGIKIHTYRNLPTVRTRENGKIILISGDSGGVGKTTISFFISIYLKRYKRDSNILIIDMDSTSNGLTHNFFSITPKSSPNPRFC